MAKFMKSVLSGFLTMEESRTSPHVLPDRSSLATTIAIVAGAWPKSAPVHPNARYTGRPGLSREYVAGLMTGAGTAVFTLPWIWILRWSWMMNLRLASDAFVRARRLNGLLQRNGVRVHWIVRWAIFLCWGAIFLVLTFRVPQNLRLLVDVGLIKGGFALALAALEYAVSDGPLGREYLVLMSQTGYLLGFGITAILTSRPFWFVAQIYWLLALALDIFFDGLVYYGLFGWRWDTTIIMYRSFPLDRLWWPMLKYGLPLAMFIVAAWTFTADDSTAKEVVRDLWVELQKTLRQKVLPKVDVALEYLDELTAFILCGVPNAAGAMIAYVYEKLPRKDLGWYSYQQLQPGQIRVLILRRSLPGVLRAELYVTSSRDAQYEAISYRWRDASLTSTLIVNGQRLAIPDAAYTAIMARSSIWRDRTIWIDAVCINQHDEVEKAHQVLMMQEIYRDSVRVLLMPDGARWRSRLTLGIIYQHGLGPEPLKVERQLSELQRTLEYGMPIDGNQWRQMGRLLALEYWRRAWVVQEVASGQTVEVYLGGHYVPWDIFRISSMFLQRPGKIVLLERNAATDFEAGIMQFDTILVMHQLRRGPDNAEGVPIYRRPEDLTKLETLLYFSVKYDSSDDKDKVFAFIALANDVDSSRDSLIRPDYTKSTEQVFEDAGCHLFLHPEFPSINLLCYAGCGFPTSRAMRYSWTPHFTRKSYIPFTNLIVKDPRFNASASMTLNVVLKKSSQGESILRIQGIVCDSVRTISTEDLPYVERPHDNIAQIKVPLVTWVQSAISMASGPVASGSRLEQCLIAEGDVKLTRQVMERWLDIYAVADSMRNDDGPNHNMTNDELLFGMMAYEACRGRRFGVTQEGRYCLVPPLTKPGDVVVVLFGAQTPYILRSVTENRAGHYRLVGEAYVQGIMHGEVMSTARQSYSFELV